MRVGLATTARLTAAATIACVFGVGHPLGLAITTLAAVELAGTFAVTPGNLSIGTAFQLADTAASIGVGLTGLVSLTRGGYWRRKLGSSESPPDELATRVRELSSASEKLGTIVLRRPAPPRPVATTVTQT